MNLEGFLNERLDGGHRGYGDTFRKAMRALQGIPLAVAGSLAYSLQVEPTYTRDVDLLVEPTMWRQAKQALRNAGFVVEGDDILARATDPETGVWIDLMFGMDDPEESAREMAKPMLLLKVSVPVVSPEFMLWMYLLSTEGRHKDRGLEILRREAADLSWLSHALHQHDLDALVTLRRWMVEAREPKRTWKDRPTPSRRKR